MAKNVVIVLLVIAILGGAVFTILNRYPSEDSPGFIPDAAQPLVEKGLAELKLADSAEGTSGGEHYALALEHFQKAAELAKDNAMVQYYLGIAYLALGNFEKATENLEASRSKQATCETLTQLASLYYQRHEIEKGDAVREELKTKFPDRADEYAFLAELRGLGQTANLRDVAPP
ncbi:MAG: tetratricopeptide repeat protein [Planctomycetes bacterium]|nr:tetratricopeptide repeat protein [Planctomycetota bacterium]